MKRTRAYALIAIAALSAASCRAGSEAASKAGATAPTRPGEARAAAATAVRAHTLDALAAALPAEAANAARSRIDAAPARFEELLRAALAEGAADEMLLFPVDKARALPEGYAPADLVALDGSGLSVNKEGHRLRRAALDAMKAMDAVARAEGVTLLVSSSYRSYAYQVEVFGRNVKESGREAALLVSAEPGHSQHQLGTAIDFGSITDAYAETRAGRWLAANARAFGFSLSFPKGMTAVTGYAWECWHYRYVGKAAAALEAEYFGGVQLYALRFLEKYEG